LTEHIVAIFETAAAAATAGQALESSGIPSSAIRQYAEKAGTVVASETSTESAHSNGGFWAWLTGADDDVPSTSYGSDRSLYEHRVQAGNTVLSVTLLDDSQIHTALSVLEAHNPVEIEEATDEAETSSTAAGTTSGSYLSGSSDSRSAIPVASSGRAQTATSPTTGDEVIPLAEEHLEVGKRMVDRGTTRIRRYVVETPVEQDVTLRGERVTVERRRPIEATNAPGVGAFEERVVEVHETEEVPVVGKTARVVEEVAIRRETTERTETMKDTVRREEVEVDKVGEPGTARP